MKGMSLRSCSCLLFLAAIVPAGCRSDAPRRVHEWTLIFHLPNDNDLAPLAEQIEQEIRRGVVGDDAAATLLIDDAGRGGMRRVFITREGVSVERLESDDSTSSETFEEFLRWSVEAHPARRYGLFLLGHGGRVDEIALDEYTGPGRPSGWASALAFGEVTRRWAATLGDGRLELLMLQQCGRATVEGLWAFRDTAPLVLASETFVGAPNTYYQPLLEHASTGQPSEPAALARVILARDRHAATLAVIQGARLSEIPGALDRLAAVIGPSDHPRLERPGDQIPTFLHDGQTTYDLCSWSRSLAAANGIAEGDVRTVVNWFSQTLVISQRFRRVSYRGVEFPYVDPTWCGVATFVPSSSSDSGSRVEHPIYGVSRWDEMLERLASPRMLLGTPEVRHEPAQQSPLP